jgi:hypothetical protein
MATQAQTEVMALRMICPHGKVRMLCSTRPDVLKGARREISEMMMAGFTSDRVPVEIARTSDMDCPECDAQWEAKKKKRGKRSADDGWDG